MATVRTDIHAGQTARGAAIEFASARELRDAPFDAQPWVAEHGPVVDRGDVPAVTQG